MDTSSGGNPQISRRENAGLHGNDNIDATNSSQIQRTGIETNIQAEQTNNNHIDISDVENEVMEVECADGVVNLNFNEFVIKSTIKKGQNEVWNHFGTIYKGNTIVKQLEKKIVCKPCFQKRKWKA